MALVLGWRQGHFVVRYAGDGQTKLIKTHDLRSIFAVPEAAVMLFRTSDERISIQQRNASGANAVRNIWVTQ